MDQEVSYKPVIQDFVWSYSRITSFLNCRWKFFMRYIRGWPETDQFYASYGSYIHKIIERFYRGELTKDEMPAEFLSGYKENVVGSRPPNASSASAIEKGLRYLNNFEPFPYKMIDVEKEVWFDIDGIPFHGCIDYIGEDEDGQLVIVDNKSRDLKPRSNRKKPTVKDRELDEMLKQLYIYAVAVKQIYGKYPAYLCFNCFKNGQFIVEPFDADKCEEAKEWAVNTIRMIEDNMEWDIDEYEYFKCNYLCGLNDRCEIFEEEKGW